MKVLILGSSGYLGYPTCCYLSERGHEICGMDDMSKEKFEGLLGGFPLFRPESNYFTYDYFSTTDFWNLSRLFESYRPEVIIHYAEMPSAPFSMKNQLHSYQTMESNVLGTLNVLWAMRLNCPEAHLIKLGTMGEYGAPDIDIEEGYLNIEHNGRKDRILYPKSGGSFYHLSKIHDSHNIEFACRVWGLRSTDLNQGIVYGVKTDEADRLSFHYDEIFGTVLNRFCTQVVAGVPLTVYGGGGQKKSFLNVRDTMRCVELAMLNPPESGEYRVFNQFTQVFSLKDLAELVVSVYPKGGDVQFLNNPRGDEREDGFYNPKNDKFKNLGLEPHLLSDVLLEEMFEMIERYRKNIDESVILPKIDWN